MGVLVTTAQEEIPQAGTLVEVRGQRWVVGEEPVPGRQGSTLLTLQSVEDGRYGESLPVIWEVEPGRRILPRRSLPEVTRTASILPSGWPPSSTRCAGQR